MQLSLCGACRALALASTCLLVLVSAQVTDQPPLTRRVTIPPLITQEPLTKMAFREHESIEMPCVANGQPEPTYTWEFNMKPFDPSGNDGRIAIQPGVGTLIFADPIKRDEGIYQCFAQNGVGKALTVKIDLRYGILDAFNSGPIRRHYPELGSSLTLRCTPPRSFPQPQVFWATVSENERQTPIHLTSRVSMDPEGNLHLANVIDSDAQEGRKYVCIIYNQVMRQTSQGDYALVFPHGQTVNKYPPRIMWQSPTHQKINRGNDWRVKCVFGGSPTPRVTWERTDGMMPARASEESFGQELVIRNVQFEDAGKYECQGVNEVTSTPIHMSFDLEVESAPYWVQQPENVDAADNERAEIFCKTAGIPEPNNFWYINGQPLSTAPADPRRIVEKERFILLNVTKDDAQVIQCNSTNKHGYIFTNAYINVLAEPPTILDPPLEAQVVAEGQTIQLTCRVFGSPKPLVVWKKGQEQLTGGRFSVLEDGHLMISEVSLVDAGQYTCTAENRFGYAENVGGLIVRRKTRIQTAPRDVMVYYGTEAKFTCTATTDPEEVDNIVIKWKKDGQIIDYQQAQRVFQNSMDNSLTISGTISLDTGKYTCVASNGLDEDEADAQLIVQGIPDPPNNVMVRCFDQERRAEVTWQPTKENYAPILNFVIQFNTTFTPDTWISLSSNITANERKQRVDLSPYGNYTFRVLARNKIGLSAPSIHTRNVCRTLEDVPDKNPENVIGEGDQPNNLVIFWTPMPKIEQNGPNFKYIVTWRSLDQENAKEESYPVERPEAYHHVIENMNNVYERFEIRVQAKNSQGYAKVSAVPVIGFSGEDTPLDAPSDLVVVDDSITGTRATLQWVAVNNETERIRGFFRGYRIQFYPTSEGVETMRETDYIINEPNQYPRPRERRQTDEYVQYILDNLPPYSDITVVVRVLNKYYAGPASSELYFTTKEGEPGPPALFEVINRGSTHFEMQWEKPVEENGILTGYMISYQTITGLNLGRLQYREPISDPDILRARLTGLQPETDYRVYISATTKIGKGEAIFLDATSSPAGPPSAPTFGLMDLGESWVVIKWEPSRSGNPGSVFYIQTRARGSYHWLHSSDEALHYQSNVSNLVSGTTYQIRVVSKNGAGDQSPAEWQEFTTGGLAPGAINLGTSAWFYGIFISIFLIIVLMVLFIILKKHTDEWWEQKESEIEEQVRQLQAEEATRQLGITNQYVNTGSRELIMDTSHASLTGSDYKEPVDDEDEDDEDDDDEDDDDYDDDEGGFNRDGMPREGYHPAGGYAGQHPGYAGQHPGYGQGYMGAPAVGYGLPPTNAKKTYSDQPPEYQDVQNKGPGSSFV